MSTAPLNPDHLDDHERAVLHLARRVRRYPGDYTDRPGWPLFKPDQDPPNIPRRSTGPVHLTFPQPVDNFGDGNTTTRT